MSDSYDYSFGLTDSDCNVGEEGIYMPKSCVETRLLARLYEVQGELLYSLFPTRLMFNSCPTRIQITLYMFYSYQAVIAQNQYLQTIPVSHLTDSFVTVGQNILTKIPVYSLCLVAT